MGRTSRIESDLRIDIHFGSKRPITLTGNGSDAPDGGSLLVDDRSDNVGKGDLTRMAESRRNVQRSDIDVREFVACGYHRSWACVCSPHGIRTPAAPYGLYDRRTRPSLKTSYLFPYHNRACQTFSRYHLALLERESSSHRGDVSRVQATLAGSRRSHTPPPRPAPPSPSRSI